ncbi:hypothetical protein VCJ71_09495 [Alteriqipengyuania sp. WL0013]|uniref:hypothetical protein n=1 Tax=Alteriqipengyuania sp. WL0013 TaxID=3110773 RepID=UPI002CB9B551|nr:hypothetical protein [Alteriqipengyuania sp. WL0013]MEB3416299.1 hypothetical protein [Alteriqipengyuania sp. WL0013]
MKGVAGLALAAAALLAGCGDGSSSVTIERSASVVKETLARVDGRINLEGLLTSPPVVKTTDGNTVSYLIKGRNGNADSHIVLTIEETGPQSATVAMTVDIAPIRAEIEGQEKVLSESLVRNALHSQLRSMERALETGQPPSKASDGLDRAIALTALATDPEQIRRAVALAESGGFGDGPGWNDGGPSRWDNGDEAMSRPEFREVEGTEVEVSEPRGEFVSGDSAMGTSPEPSDW